MSDFENITKTGKYHWKFHRMSSLALVPLSIWFAIFAFMIAQNPITLGMHYIQNPIHAICAMLFICISLLYFTLEAEDIILDYIQHKTIKKIALIWVKFAGILTAMVFIFGIVKIHFGV